MRAERARTSAILLAFASGIAHALSLSIAGLWWLQLLSFGLLALLLTTAASTPAPTRARAAFLKPAILGFAFGVGWFLAGVSWLFISMHRYGGLPAPLAASALLFFCAYLALFPAAASALANLLCRPRTHINSARSITGYAVALAGAFTLFELLRGWLFTGFPWLAPGYAHVDGPLSALSPLIGSFGVGAAACLLGALVVLALAAGLRSRQLPVAPVVVIIAVAAAGLLARQAHWGVPADSVIRADLIQGNIAQDMKFDPARTRAAMLGYAQALVPGRAQLIVMPETAWTLPWPMTPPEIAARIRAALGDGALAAIGMPLAAADGSPRLTNSVAVIDSGGGAVARYDKVHLVPFGEFIPWGFRWFVNMMNIPLGDFGRGAIDQAMLRLNSNAIAFNICYEDLFGDELARQVRAGANLLVNVSNIAWFGDSHAHDQHLQIARMRALELARPMLRATNTGVTAAIDHRGQVIARLPGHEFGTLSVSIAPATGLTPFARWANLPAWLLAIGLLIVGCWLARQADPLE